MLFLRDGVSEVSAAGGAAVRAHGVTKPSRAGEREAPLDGARPRRADDNRPAAPAAADTRAEALDTAALPPALRWLDRVLSR